MKEIGWYFPSDFFCKRTAPEATFEASVSRMKGLEVSGKERTGSEENRAFRSSSAFCSVDVHCFK